MLPVWGLSVHFSNPYLSCLLVTQELHFYKNKYFFIMFTVKFHNMTTDGSQNQQSLGAF